MPTSKHAPKKKSYHLQARLHEDVPGELGAVEVCINLHNEGWTDREIGAAALRALKRQMDSGIYPEQTITQVVVDAKMMQLFDMVIESQRAWVDLAENLNNGTWTQSEAAQHANEMFNKIGISMESANHASQVIDIDVEEW